ncbi:hypothetical protein EX30DRAFT_369934 [Ascodesmis nigricans]|uniref:Uncharacterized protein n=1 Tax=Ascodesmis nigricans TaxID=341454 RepID=A0A4S2N180_9PEZI|nr:hypothetical protein EX30DRAFT_369934 [Ascodesmis nigricans]
MTNPTPDTDEPESVPNLDSLKSAHSFVSFPYIFFNTDRTISIALPRDYLPALIKLNRGQSETHPSTGSSGNAEHPSVLKGRVCIHFDSITGCWNAYPTVSKHDAFTCPLQKHKRSSNDSMRVDEGKPTVDAVERSTQLCCAITTPTTSAGPPWRAVLRFSNPSRKVEPIIYGRHALSGVLFQCCSDGSLKRCVTTSIPEKGIKIYDLGLPENFTDADSPDWKSSTVDMQIFALMDFVVESTQKSDEEESNKLPSGKSNSPQARREEDGTMELRRVSASAGLRKNPDSCYQLGFKHSTREDMDGQLNNTSNLTTANAHGIHAQPLGVLPSNALQLNSPPHLNLQAQVQPQVNPRYTSENVPPMFKQQRDGAVYLENEARAPPHAPPESAKLERNTRIGRSVSANHANSHTFRSTTSRSQRRPKPSALFRSYSTADLGAAREVEEQVEPHQHNESNATRVDVEGKQLPKPTIRFATRPFHTVRMHEPEKGSQRPQLRRTATDEGHGYKRHTRHKSPAPPLNRVSINSRGKLTLRHKSPAPPPLVRKRSALSFGKKIPVPSTQEAEAKVTGASLITRSLLGPRLKADEESEEAEAQRTKEKQAQLDGHGIHSDDDDDDRPIISPPGSYMSSPHPLLSSENEGLDYLTLPSNGRHTSPLLEQGMEQDNVDKPEHQLHDSSPRFHQDTTNPTPPVASGNSFYLPQFPNRPLTLEEIIRAEDMIEERKFRQKLGTIKNWFRWPPVQVSAEFLPRNLKWMDWRVGPNGDQWTRSMGAQPGNPYSSTF